MTEEKLRIINAAENIYLSKGYYKTTVDELARTLGISKKTIYKHFPGKKELLAAVVEQIKEELRREFTKILESDGDPVTKTFFVFQEVAKRIQKLSGNWLEDLAIYGNDIWKGVEEFRRNFIQNNLIKLIEEGKELGYFIDQPPVLIINIILASANSVVNPKFLINTNISAKQAVSTTLNIIFTGILTKRGLKIFEKIKGKKNEDYE